MTDWQRALRESMAADPELAVYLNGIDPRTSIKQALGDYIRLLELRAQTTDKEAREGDELVAIMDAHGFEDTHELWAAVERGEIELPESAVESLVRLGILGDAP